MSRTAQNTAHFCRIRRGRGLPGYTPAGFVVTTAVASGEAMEQKVILQDMNLEMEVQDSQSQAVLVAIVDKIKAGKKAKASDS